MKKFEEYIKQFSKDPKVFEKQVVFASNLGGSDIFEVVNDTSTNFTDIDDHPVILWDNFNIEGKKINESSSHIYNSVRLPSFGRIREQLSNESYIAPSTKDRAQVKSLKFPIIASKDGESEMFKTYGKYKKSEKFYDSYRQKIVPTTKFDVIAFKGDTIHIQEKINGIGFDADLSRFKHPAQVTKIAKKVNEKFKADFYHMELLETNGKLFLNNVTTSAKLSPTQNVKMYEAAYESFYDRRLPKWYRDQVFEKHTRPYYEKSYLNALLIKPKYAINFKKYAKHK